MARIVTCLRGHQWELTDEDISSTSNLDSLCPECSGEYRTPPLSLPAPHRFRPLDPSAGDLSEKMPFISGYELLSVIGRGGMGVVYRARQVALNRMVAVKMLRFGAEVPEELLRRFRTEAESTAELHHPNIIQLYEVGEVDGQPFLVMEFVNGGTLAARLARAPLLPQAAATVVGVLARATDAAHHRGIVHRDLKPANVLLDLATNTDPNVDLELGLRLGILTLKVSDFGLAKRMDHDAQTHTGAAIGTPSYMAPEQAAGGSREVGPAADVYALGVILYECLTGRPPFRAATPLETLDQVRHVEPIPPSRFQPRLPRDLQTICLKCLEKNPSRRYASAADLAADLDRFTHGLPVRARPVGVLGRMMRWAKRQPTAAALVAVSLFMVAGGVVGLFAHNTRLRAEIERTQQQETETARQKAAALEQVRRGHQALDDIFTSLDNAPVGMSRNAAFRAMYEEQAKAILRFYHDTLQTGDVADPEVRLHRGLVSVYAGRMQQRLGNPTAAEVDYRQAQELLASLAKQPDAPPAHRLEWANCCYWFGTLLQQTGRLNDAEQTYNHAVAVLTPLEASGSVGERDRRVAALCYTRMVENEWRKGRHETAARHAHEATARWDQFLAADPDNELHRLWATQTLRYHAMAAWMSRNWDDLDAVASRADIEREWYARHPPGRRAGLTGRVELGELYHSLGVSASERGDMPAAVTRLSQAINLLETVLQVDSTSPDARIRVATIFRNRAMIRGGTTEALADWDRAVELTDGELAVGYRIERAAARLVAGDWKRAVNELDAVAAASLDGIRAKELGQAFARAAEVVPEAMRDGLKVKAVAAVRRAVEKGGFPNREAFREYLNNPVFAAIRTWAEFDEWERKIK